MNENVHLSYPGTSSEAVVPDTLDLADRARLAINGLTGTADPAHNYETYQCANFNVHPPYMNHMYGGPCRQKPLEALPMMRVMSGSAQNLDVQAKMLEGVLSEIDENGLWWLRGEGRPWHQRSFKEDMVFVCSHARLMVALMAWERADGDTTKRGSEFTDARSGLSATALSTWFETIQSMADGLGRIAVYKDDYAHYPGDIYWETGWETTEELPSGWGGRWSIADGLAIHALSRWYAMSGDDKARELAGKLVNFALRLENWQPTQEPKMIVSAEHAHWSGHFHATTMRVWGLLEYAIATNNARLKQFVREFYEYSRNFGISRIGFFPAVAGEHGSYPDKPQVAEGCAVADMTCLAVRLSDAGVGDYWEDVEQYVRNHLVELQFLRRDLLEEISAAGPGHQIDPKVMTDENVLERNIGTFTSGADPTMLLPLWTMCCVGNCSVAFYKAWESIVRCTDGVAQVNLLLNRASPWLDVDSYLPYEGKVVLKNKTAKKIHLHIPMWVDKTAVRYQVNGKNISPLWLNNYLIIDPVAEKDVVTIEFPMVETTERYTEPTYETQYICRFKGNTLIDISPRASIPAWATVGQDDGVTAQVIKGYPIYEREHYKGNKAPMKKTVRYVSSIII